MTNEPTAFDGAGDRRAAPPPGAPDAAATHPGEDTVTTTMVSVPADAQTEAMPDASDPAVERPDDQTDDHGLVSPGGFPIVLRGYDRHRVDAAFAELRADLDAAVARYEVAEAALTAARSAVDDAERLAAEAKAVAQQVGRQAEEAARVRSGRPAPARLAERIRQMLELAEEEAAEIRATARAEADREVAASRAEVGRLQERRTQLGQELARLQAHLATLLQGSGSPSARRPTQ
jgi:hypothetical protein